MLQISNREAATECSPRRKPWVQAQIEQAPKEREKHLLEGHRFQEFQSQ
jgi:hypothetical protein